MVMHSCYAFMVMHLCYAFMVKPLSWLLGRLKQEDNLEPRCSRDASTSNITNPNLKKYK